MADAPSESDLQQVVAYAVELGVDRAFLVYPSVAAKPVVIHIGDVKIATVGIDLTRPASESWLLFCEAIGIPFAEIVASSNRSDVSTA